MTIKEIQKQIDDLEKRIHILEITNPYIIEENNIEEWRRKRDNCNRKKKGFLNDLMWGRG